METEKLYIHRVESKKENLRTIAAWYTGNPNHWRTLLSYNGHIRPFALSLSVPVRIPEQLIVRFDPIDPAFIAKNQISYSSLKKKTLTKKNEATPGNTTNTEIDTETMGQGSEDQLEVQQEKLIENLL